MHRTRVMSILAFAMNLVVSYLIPGMAQSPGSREDEEAIRKVIVEVTEGFNQTGHGSRSCDQRAQWARQP
jgi:hypothetical protein